MDSTYPEDSPVQVDNVTAWTLLENELSKCRNRHTSSANTSDSGETRAVHSVSKFLMN